MDRRTGSDVAAIVVLIVLVLFSALVVLGGGAFFWLRARNLQRAAVTERARAMVVHQRARQARRDAQMARPADPSSHAPPEALAADIDMAHLADQVDTDRYRTTIKLDNFGKMELNGRRVRVDELFDVLSHDGRTYEMSVVIKAEDECPFKHVANVLSLCEQIGIANVQVAAAASD